MVVAFRPWPLSMACRGEMPGDQVHGVPVCTLPTHPLEMVFAPSNRSCTPGRFVQSLTGPSRSGRRRSPGRGSHCPAYEAR